MKKIGVVGLHSIDNMGDRLICETTRYILDDVTTDLEVTKIDAAPRGLSSYSGLQKARFLLSALFIRASFFASPRSKPCSNTRYRIESWAWRLKLHQYFNEALADCDAVIFAGGGFLKFRTQGLNYIVEQVVEICERKGLPVMLSAVGIEGYDRDDHRCLKLKQALQSGCIRAITTRDYLEILQEQYEIPESTRTCLVGDPAFWATDCYGIRKNPSSNKVGINLIRSDIFRHYGNRLSAASLKTFYLELITILDQQGTDWFLFSNGMGVDHDFGLELIKTLGAGKERLLPPPRTACELMQIIAEFRVILGARMHACISAYALDIPVAGLIWNEKLSRFAESTDQRDMFLTEDELSAETIGRLLLEPSGAGYDETLRRELRQRTQDEIVGFLKTVDALK